MLLLIDPNLTPFVLAIASAFYALLLGALGFLFSEIRSLSKNQAAIKEKQIAFEVFLKITAKGAAEALADSSNPVSAGLKRLCQRYARGDELSASEYRELIIGLKDVHSDASNPYGERGIALQLLGAIGATRPEMLRLVQAE